MKRSTLRCATSFSSAGRLEDVQQECAEVDIDAIKCSCEQSGKVGRD